MTDDQFNTLLTRIRKIERILAAKHTAAQKRSKYYKSTAMLNRLKAFLTTGNNTGHDTQKNCRDYLHSQKFAERSIARLVRRIKDRQVDGFYCDMGRIFYEAPNA